MKEGEDLDKTRYYKYNQVVPEPPNSDESLSYSKTVQEQEEPTCRICMDIETKTNILLHPCHCKGTMKYVHEECLKAWLISQNAEIDNPQCELCKTGIQMEFKIVAKCIPKEACREGPSQFFVIPMFCIVMIMLFLIVFLLGESYLNTAESDEQKGYTIALMITCSLSGLVILVLVVNSIKEACYTVKLEKWNIYNQEFPDEDCPENKEENREPIQVLVIPDSIRVHGHTIKTPPLNPSLPRIVQRGRTVAYTPVSAHSSLLYHRPDDASRTDPLHCRQAGFSRSNSSFTSK